MTQEVLREKLRQDKTAVARFVREAHYGERVVHPNVVRTIEVGEAGPGLYFLAIEWAKSGVCVNAIAPGVFRTDLNSALLDGTDRGREFLLRTPMKRFGKLDELGGAAVFLASESASFVTGHVLAVDGGFLASGVNQ